MEKKIYKEANKSEQETTINVIYNENILSIYTNKVDLQKQLNKLIEVLKVRELKPENTIKRELALIKVHAPDEKTKSEIIQYTNIFRGHIVDVTPKTLTVEITGEPTKIGSFTKLLKPFGIKETAKTGVTALTRGHKTL